MTLGPLAVAATFTTYLTATAVNSLTALRTRVAAARPDNDSTTERGGTHTMTETQTDVETRRRRSLPLRLLALAIAALLGAALIAGCSSTTHHRTTTTVTTVADNGSMTMVAYGEHNHCYYVDSPAEALALIAAGLCPAGWTPYRMPTYWEDEYWYYYDSPTYIRGFVPQARQTTYNTTIVSFQKSNSSAIASASKTATYKTSSGKTVTAPPSASLKFGNDDSFGAAGAKNGAGNLRASSPSGAAPAKTITTAPPAAKSTTAAAPAKSTASAPGGNLRKPAPPAKPAPPVKQKTR